MIPQNENFPSRLKTNNSLNKEFPAELLIAFRKAARTSVWYKKLLHHYECNASAIKTAEDFRNLIPVLTKESIFKKIPFNQLVKCVPSTIQSIMLSSGQTGHFSIGIITRKEFKKLSTQTDIFLESLFGIKKGEALVINASAMGVRTFTSHTCCDTGPRADIVVEILRKISSCYLKTVIIADPYLIKQIVEEAIEADFDFSTYKVWFISGGEWLPETLRRYVHQLTGKNAEKPDEGYWSAIYGVTELGYPLFFETPQLAALRATISDDNALYTSGLTYRMGKCTTPFIFEYFNEHLFVEQINNEEGVPELVFTPTDVDRVIPLIRYKTGDVGELVDLSTLNLPEQGMGQIVFWGRYNNWLSTESGEIMINDIRELIFMDSGMAGNSTGYFTIQKINGNILLAIQLKKGCKISSEMKSDFTIRLNTYYPFGIEVSFEAYHLFEQQMELDVERKFNHLKK